MFTLRLIGLVFLSFFLLGQASGGIVEFWSPGPDITVKQFREVDQGFFVISHLRCQSFTNMSFRYGLADTLFATPFTSDTTNRCIVFVNDNPVTEDMFPSF